MNYITIKIINDQNSILLENTILQRFDIGAAS